MGKEQAQQLAGSISKYKTNNSIKSDLINLEERLSEVAYSRGTVEWQECISRFGKNQTDVKF